MATNDSTQTYQAWYIGYKPDGTNSPPAYAGINNSWTMVLNYERVKSDPEYRNRVLKTILNDKGWENSQCIFLGRKRSGVWMVYSYPTRWSSYFQNWLLDEDRGASIPLSDHRSRPLAEFGIDLITDKDLSEPVGMYLLGEDLPIQRDWWKHSRFKEITCRKA